MAADDSSSTSSSEGGGWIGGNMLDRFKTLVDDMLEAGRGRLGKQCLIESDIG